MRFQLMSLDQMRTFAEALAGLLRAGDLLILSGNLGAGEDDLHPVPGQCSGGGRPDHLTDVRHCAGASFAP